MAPSELILLVNGLVLVLVLPLHYRVMQNKKSISNLFCILEDHNINPTRVFKPLSWSEAWSGDMVDPEPLQPGQSVLEAFRQERAAQEARRTARRKWLNRTFIGAAITAVLVYVLRQLT